MRSQSPNRRPITNFSQRQYFHQWWIIAAAASAAAMLLLLHPVILPTSSESEISFARKMFEIVGRMLLVGLIVGGLQGGVLCRYAPLSLSLRWMLGTVIGMLIGLAISSFIWHENIATALSSSISNAYNGSKKNVGCELGLLLRLGFSLISYSTFLAPMGAVVGGIISFSASFTQVAFSDLFNSRTASPWVIINTTFGALVVMINVGIIAVVLTIFECSDVDNYRGQLISVIVLISALGGVCLGAIQSMIFASFARYDHIGE